MNTFDFGIEVHTTSNPSSISAGIFDNMILTGAGAGSIGIRTFTNINGSSICAHINGNTVTPQATSGTNDISISTSTSTAVINLDNNFNNVASDIQINGNVNFVPPGTCGQ